ncbi:MAG TPA: hypothetical protein VF832_14410 [Longimicrobiales bacterium]
MKLPLLLLPLSCALVGCFPMVTHGPAVHPGGSGGFTFDLATGTTFQSNAVDRSAPPLVPMPQIILRQGSARGPFGQPAHMGLQLQPFALVAGLGSDHIDPHAVLLGSDLDLYTQLRGGRWDRGVGVLAGIDHLSAYYEAGPPLHGTGTWYMVHQATYVDAGERHIFALASTIARTESGFRGRAAHLGLTVALGADRGAGGFPTFSTRPFALVIGSMSLEFFGGQK